MVTILNVKPVSQNQRNVSLVCMSAKFFLAWAVRLSKMKLLCTKSNNLQNCENSTQPNSDSHTPQPIAKRPNIRYCCRYVFRLRSSPDRGDRFRWRCRWFPTAPVPRRRRFRCPTSEQRSRRSSASSIWRHPRTSGRDRRTKVDIRHVKASFSTTSFRVISSRATSSRAVPTVFGRRLEHRRNPIRRRYRPLRSVWRQLAWRHLAWCRFVRRHWRRLGPPCTWRYRFAAWRHLVKCQFVRRHLGDVTIQLSDVL